MAAIRVPFEASRIQPRPPQTLSWNSNKGPDSRFSGILQAEY